MEAEVNIKIIVYQKGKWEITMKSKTITILSIAVINNYAMAQTDLIFKNGMESYLIHLNDTGITFEGEHPTGTDEDCNISVNSPKQDCNTGRDWYAYDHSDGHAGFSFTKLDANGVPLADQSVDYEILPWSCVKDNVTGLVWEVKTTTTGIHNKENLYQWGGLTALGRDHPLRQGGYYDPSWNELVLGSNNESLCGFNNWLVPTVDELSNLVNQGTRAPAIDTNYFPNTVRLGYWTSSPFLNGGSMAWIVYYLEGANEGGARENYYRVRLVRGDRK